MHRPLDVNVARVASGDIPTDKVERATGGHAQSKQGAPPPSHPHREGWKWRCCGGCNFVAHVLGVLRILWRLRDTIGQPKRVGARCVNRGLALSLAMSAIAGGSFARFVVWSRWYMR